MTTGSTNEPRILDGVEFVVIGPEAEQAFRDGALVGEYTPDDDTRRAYLVSKIRA